MHEDAAMEVIRYMDVHLFKPEIWWPADIFEERSYARWAANEILRRIIDDPFAPPDLIVVEFMCKMSALSFVDETENGRIFAIARETAENILYLLM